MHDPLDIRQQRLEKPAAELVAELEQLEDGLKTQSQQLAEERLRAALSNVTDGFALYRPDGKLEMCNDAFRMMHGYGTAETTPGVSTYDQLGKIDYDNSNFKRLPLNFEERRAQLQKDGPTVVLQYLEDRVQERRQSLTPEGGIVSIVRDITERKRLEEALRQANEMLRQHSQAKTAFLSNMAHEIRTPMNAILGFAESMTDHVYGDLGDARYDEYARIIVDSGRHLLSLVNDVLDVSKIEAGALELEEAELDLPQLLQSVVAMLRGHGDEAGVHIELECDDAPALLYADERSLRQILINLLSNGIKFTPAGGSVTLSAAVDDEGRPLLRVADTGIGIPDSDLQMIFEPFRQARSSHNHGWSGTGLGLTVTRSLVHSHGGTISIESTPGEGSTVTVRLPAHRLRS
ncbi:ATP-binding protein [Hwanghaeella sp.]|uniref:PAS domain-containing sensor histidine kinase n=1 Tax=Hwanghaeella sp. TaxID=2605943 RepID=UPI003CCBD464